MNKSDPVKTFSIGLLYGTTMTALILAIACMDKYLWGEDDGQTND